MVIFYSSVKLPEGTTKTVDETLVLPWHGPWPWIWWCWVYIITVYTQVWLKYHRSYTLVPSEVVQPLNWYMPLTVYINEPMKPLILDDSPSLLNGRNGQPQGSSIGSYFCFGNRWRMWNSNAHVDVGFGMVTWFDSLYQLLLVIICCLL